MLEGRTRLIRRKEKTGVGNRENFVVNGKEAYVTILLLGLGISKSRNFPLLFTYRFVLSPAPDATIYNTSNIFRYSGY